MSVLSIGAQISKVHGRRDNPEKAMRSPLNESTLALVLAGGNGTRLGDLTRSECKPALPFGGKYRNIDFSLSNCVNSGIRRIAVVTQYKAQTLLRHLDDAWSFLPSRLGEFVEAWPAQQRVQPDWYSGTANALFQNLDLIRKQAPRFVLVLAGDHVYKMDYRYLLAQHEASGAGVTVACVPVPAEDAAHYGVVTPGPDRRIADFVEKPSANRVMPREDGKVLASMGVYVFEAGFLCQLLEKDAVIPGSAHDFGRDILPAAVRSREADAFVFTDPQTGRSGYWRDVGTIDAYWQAHMELIDPATAFTLIDPAWPILTHSRQLPPAMVQAGARHGVIADSIVCDGCVVSDATVVNSVLGSAARVNWGSTVEHSVLLPDVTIGAQCHLHRVIVDSGCEVPAGTVIGRNKELDAQRYQVSDTGVVLVTQASLAQSVRLVA
jgi:glucose-1-phosphate adenylyltransferase